MAAAGLTADDFAGEALEVFPDNEQAFLLFAFLSTQWRVGMNGKTGLDYLVMYHKMDRLKLDEDAYSQLENDMQLMERTALEEMNQPD